MQIVLRTLLGKSIPVEINSNDTIQDIKDKVFELEGIPVDCQRLIFAGRGLEDSRYLSDYGIRSNSIIHLVLRLRHNQ